MCIIFAYTDPNPPKGGYRLIVASNRDEYYKRPARAAFRCPETGIIGGRDVEVGREGGMWFGIVSKPSGFKLAALLNVTGEAKKPTNAGRGPLVYNYLRSEDSAPEYVQGLGGTYNAFNLIMLEVVRDGCKIYHHSNAPRATFEYQGKQVLGFGNSTPGAPFAKVKNGQLRFEEIVRSTKGKDVLVEKLLEMLKCEDLHLPDSELERRAPAALNLLSSIFVRIPEVGYGTRTHSVVLVDEECNVEFVEHTMKEPIDSENPEWEVTVIKSHL